METIVYGPLELPSGKKIYFKAPTGQDRNNVLQMTQIAAERAISDSILVDDYVAAHCVTEVDGQPTDGDYKRLFNTWLQKDILFYRAVFDKMFGLDKEEQDKIEEAAAFLLNGRTSTAGCSSPGNAG